MTIMMSLPHNVLHDAIYIYRPVPNYGMENTCLIIGCDQDHGIVCRVAQEAGVLQCGCIDRNRM